MSTNHFWCFIYGRNEWIGVIGKYAYTSYLFHIWSVKEQWLERLRQHIEAFKSTLPHIRLGNSLPRRPTDGPNSEDIIHLMPLEASATWGRTNDSATMLSSSPSHTHTHTHAHTLWPLSHPGGFQGQVASESDVMAAYCCCCFCRWKKTITLALNSLTHHFALDAKLGLLAGLMTLVLGPRFPLLHSDGNMPSIPGILKSGLQINRRGQSRRRAPKLCPQRGQATTLYGGNAQGHSGAVAVAVSVPGHPFGQQAKPTLRKNRGRFE